MSKEIKTLSPKLDVVFQALFGEVGNERITKGFLESILKEKIDKIDLSKNPILRRELRDEKLGVLDILTEINGKEICNIEMQVVNQDSIIERILYYWGRLYTRQIKAGEDYKELKRTIVILIADFKIESLKEVEYHSKWQIMETKGRKVILTEKFEIDILELPKIEGKENIDDELLDWLYFLENPKSERVQERMKENKKLKEAGEKLDGLSEDERMQRIADLRLKAIMDEKAIYRQGIIDGKKEGQEKGRREYQIEMVKNMLEEKIDISVISKITGLTKEEIEKIAKNK